MFMLAPGLGSLMSQAPRHQHTRVASVGNNTYSATTISFHRSLCVDLNRRVSSYLMGPLRKSKRARTKPPSVEETVAGSAPTLPQVEDSSSVTKPSTPVPDTPKGASDKQEDAPTALRCVKAEASSSKPVCLQIRNRQSILTSM